MKRLGWPMAKENRWGLAFLAVLTVVAFTGCGARKTAGTGDTSDIPDTLVMADGAGDTDSLASGDINSIVQGAYDDTNVANSNSPSGIGSASSAQSYCSSATAESQGSNFFTNLISQGGISGADSAACFTGSVNTQQLMYANYVQISVLQMCQNIALQQLAQTPESQEALDRLFQFATVFIPQCASNSVGIEGSFGYGQYLSRAAATRVTALRAGAWQLLQGAQR